MKRLTGSGSRHSSTPWGPSASRRFVRQLRWSESPVADPEREAAERGPRLVGRDGLPRVVPLNRHEVGDLGALDVDDRQELTGRDRDRPSLPGRHEDGALAPVAHRAPTR
jgi:hypothetical protein